MSTELEITILASLFTNQGTPEGDIPKCFVPDIPGLSRILGTLAGDIPEVLTIDDGIAVLDHVRILIALAYKAKGRQTVTKTLYDEVLIGGKMWSSVSRRYSTCGGADGAGGCPW